MKPESTLVLMVTAVGSREDALALARAVVQEGLCACAQLEPIESVYRWQGRVQQEPEIRLLLKTTAAGVPALQNRVLALHPYDLPALYTLHAAEASQAFVDWVRDNSPGPR